jgi:hypothetical protein
MTYAQAWNEAAPPGTLPANQIDTAIQQDKIAVRERMVSLGVTGWATEDPVGFNQLNFIGANPKIIPGTASIRIRNRADNQTNVEIFDAGDIEVFRDVIVNRNIRVKSKQAYNEPLVVGDVTGAVTVNWNNGANQHLRFTGAVTFTFSNPIAGSFYFLRIQQDGTGNRIVTWPGAVRFPTGSVTTLTTTANRVDCIGFYYDGTNYLGWFVARNLSV